MLNCVGSRHKSRSLNLIAKRSTVSAILDHLISVHVALIFEHLHVPTRKVVATNITTVTVFDITEQCVQTDLHDGDVYGRSMKLALDSAAVPVDFDKHTRVVPPNEISIWVTLR